MSYNLNQIDPDGRPRLYAEPREEMAPARPRRLLAAVTALLVMCLFAGGLWFAYIEGLRHASGTTSNDVPLIRADARPIKVKPANPGGIAIPDRNLLIYDEGRPTTEHLLPPPEQPMARPAPPAPAPTAPPPQAPPPAQIGPPQRQAAVPATAPATAGQVPVETASLPTAADRGSSPAAASAQRNGHDHTSKRNAAPAPADRPRVSSEGARVDGAPVAAGGVRLQLGSVRSAASAREEWDRIRRGNADLLGNISAAAVRADLGDKGVYFRIQTAPVGDVAHASRLCGELRQRHLGCIIVR